MGGALSGSRNAAVLPWQSGISPRHIHTQFVPHPLTHSLTPPPLSTLFHEMESRISNERIEDPETFVMLNRIGATRLSYIGSLVQRWESCTTRGLSLTFAERIMNEGFIKDTKSMCNTATTDIASMQKKLVEMKTAETSLREELVCTKKEFAESKKDISRLLVALDEMKQKYGELEQKIAVPITETPLISSPASASASPSLSSIKKILFKFNKENPEAVKKGDASGVTFNNQQKITDLDSLVAFLETQRAKELGVPSDILETFKVFVVEGKLVTLSDEYDGGVGYSFLWKKKMSLRGATTNGWCSDEAKENDPRLGVDPSTGKNYVDPETGVTWVHPKSDNSTKKRSGDEVSLQQEKRMRSGSPVSGEKAVKEKEEEEEIFI